MKYRVRHITLYDYSEDVTLCHNEVHLKPRNHAGQTCLSADVSITPEPAVMKERTDYFGNRVAFFTVQEHHREMEVAAFSEIDVQALVPPAASLTPAWEDVRDGMRGPWASRHIDAAQFLFDSQYVRSTGTLAAYAAHSFTPGRPILDAVLDLTQRIHAEFKYDPSATTMATSIEESFAQRRGVCQDFAHIQIGCLRALGLPARYVSGYLLTQPPPGKEKLVGADASHAWLSFYCPGFGWIDVDPTNNVIPGDKHVLVAWGRDYADVAPVRGVILGGGQHSIKVSVDVLLA